MKKRLLCALLALLAVVGAPATLAQARPEAAPGTAAHSQGSPTALANQAARERLRGWGYTVTTDAQLQRAVLHFQRANRIPQTGVVDALTLKTMGLVVIDATAPTTKPAPAPPAPSNLKCPQYAAELQANGLPVAYFDRVMYRESRCEADAYNGRHRDRSYGLLQINTKGALWGELKWRCGLKFKEQLYTASVNIRCAAKLYQAYGRRPWGG
jgi:hypothetical protein